MDNSDLKSKRIKLGLSIDEVDTYTNIRAHVIRAIEEGKEHELPTPYINAFKKTLEDFYNDALKNNTLKKEKELKKEKTKLNNNSNTTNINDNVNDDINDIDTDKTNIIYIDDTINDYDTNDDIEGFEVIKESDTNIIDNYDKNISISNNKELEDISSIEQISVINDVTEDGENEQKEKTNNKSINKLDTYKKNYIDNKSNINQNNKKETIEINTSVKSKTSKQKIYNKQLSKKAQIYLIYAIMGSLLIATIYFIFFYGKNDAYDEVEFYNDSIKTKENDILVLTSKKDSLILEAYCIDTAWVKIDIDGKECEDLIMIKDETKRWSAADFMILSMSNVGNIKFYKNDTLLPNLGAPGSMVRNIKLTKQGISNVRPLENDNEEIPVDNINANYRKLNPSQPDTNALKDQKLYTKRREKKKKAEEKPLIPVLDFSTPEKTKPPVLE